MKPTLLLVEDDPDDVELTLYGFRQYGLEAEVAVAADGAAALELLLERYGAAKPLPAAIVTDLKMPRIDGLELLRRLKADPRLPHIPVLVLTSSPREEDRLEALQNGAVGCVLKPADLAGYAAIVDRVVSIVDGGLRR